MTACQNPGSAAFRKVNLSNNYFARTVVSVAGGLALFRLGPCSFALSSSADSHCFEVCVNEVVIGGGGAGAGAASGAATITTGLWLRWIDKYAKFCAAIANLLE